VNLSPDLGLLNNISECEARVTGATVGEIVLNYHGGCKSITPLVVGKNIGNILKYCGEETRRVKAGKIVFDPPIPGYSVEDVYAHILEIPCDASVTLASIGIDIMAADVQLGLLGVNVYSETMR